MRLADYVRRAAVLHGDRPAVSAPDGAATYTELDALADAYARAFHLLGVKAGDRVGVWFAKSVQAVAALQGILRLGALYVPIDPLSPDARAKKIIENCGMNAVLVHAAKAACLAETGVAVLAPDGPLADYRGGRFLDAGEFAAIEPFPLPTVAPTLDDPAYILYTSGSTGMPKGVCISHRNAMAFIDWAAHALGLGMEDRLSNHAPFHFDLSVFDIYAAFKVGACVHLIGDGMSYAPKQLTRFVVDKGITVWYSVPSVLIMMMDDGGLLEAPVHSLRHVVFAGEPFPMKQLRRLVQGLPAPRYFNFYGPTETNVCTYHEVAPEDLALSALPIGRASSGDRVWAEGADGAPVGPGGEGELKVSGPTVMCGYWGRPPQKPVYGTGDLVRVREDGGFLYVGRLDQMVKIRGFRVEPGEVEAALEAHEAVAAAAAVVVGSGIGARLIAFLVCRADAAQPAFLALKQHCAGRVQRYMIPDDFQFLDALPRTRNGKVDRTHLKQILEGSCLSS